MLLKSWFSRILPYLAHKLSSCKPRLHSKSWLRWALRFRRFIHVFVFLGTNRKLLVNYAWKTKGKKPFSRKQIFGFPEWPTIISLGSGPYMNAIKLVFPGKLSVFRLDQFYFKGLWCSCFRIDTVWNNCGLYIWLGALSPCLKLVSSRNER